MDERRGTGSSSEHPERTSTPQSGQGTFGASTPSSSTPRGSQASTAHPHGAERAYGSEHPGPGVHSAGTAYGTSERERSHGRSTPGDPRYGAERSDHRTRDFRRGMHRSSSAPDELGSPSVLGVIRGLARDVGLLARQEAQLARVEIGEKVDQAKRGVAGLAVGAAVAYAGFLLVLGAITFALDLAVENLWLSFLIVGGTVHVVGLLLLVAAKKKLEPESLAPEKTARSLRDDADMVRNQTRRTHV